MSPTLINAELNERVVGQTRQKARLALLMEMHTEWFTEPDLQHTTPNALLLGPSGVGKTYSIRVASEALQIPFVTLDSSNLLGLDSSQIASLVLERLLVSAVNVGEEQLRWNSEDAYQIASRGIVVIDEFDKLRNTHEHYNPNNDLTQRSLLKLLEGGVTPLPMHDSRIPGMTHADTPRRLDTSGIMFIMAGAFSEMYNMSTGRLNDETRAGRDVHIQRDIDDPETIVPGDVIKYGFLRELVGRLPVCIEYSPLKQTDLKIILGTERLSPLTAWQTFFARRNASINITDDAADLIASRASRLGMGARGLEAILFPIISDQLHQPIEEGGEYEIQQVENRPTLINSNQ